MATKLIHTGALGIIDGKLVQTGKKCNCCGKISYPVMELCPYCGADDSEVVALSEKGTVYSHSITRPNVGPYKGPFVNGYIDLPEDVRVFGMIHVDDLESVTNGMQVKVETGVVYTEPDGTEVLGYYYVPAPVKGGRK